MPKRALVTGLVVVATAVVGMAPADAAGPTSEPGSASTSRSLVNQERSSRGHGTLASSARLNAIAREHSEDMARDGELRHHPNLPGAVGDYQSLGENVGQGPDADAIHAGFMGSTHHRVNILGRSYTQIGIGAVRDEHGTLWITQIFFEPRSQGGTGSGGGSGSTGGSGSGGSGSGSTAARAPASATGTGTDVARVRAQTSSVRAVRERATTPRKAARSSGQARTLSMLDVLNAVPAAVAPTGSAAPTPTRLFV